MGSRMESLERSLQKWCLEQNPRCNTKDGEGHSTSQISLPHHWEQCLNFKTGEMCYINWSNGMKVREDPRTTTAGYNGDYDSEEVDEDEEEEEELKEYKKSGSSEGWWKESYPCSKLNSSVRKVGTLGGKYWRYQEIRQDSILVVAGCNSCLMYHMVARNLDSCPKCSAQLFHFPPTFASSPSP